MNMRARNVAWLLPFFLSGCSLFHKTQLQPDQWFAPPLANLPKPAVFHAEIPESALILPDLPLAMDSSVEPEDLPPIRHKRLVKPAQQADNTILAPDENAGVSAIGTLSSGQPSNLRSATEDSIVATERGLNGLNRNFSEQEQRTVGQIREYLRQAREALNSGDVDGAKTLAAKAKAVLSELSQ